MMIKAKKSEMDPPDTDAILDALGVFEVALGRRLDELIGENTLFAALDGTLASKLLPHMLTDLDVDLISLNILVDEATCESGDRVKIVSELVGALFGIAQFFRYCDEAITADWMEVMQNLAINEDLQMLPPSEFASVVSIEARAKGMNDQEIFALLQYLRVFEDTENLQ